MGCWYRLCFIGLSINWSVHCNIFYQNHNNDNLSYQWIANYSKGLSHIHKLTLHDLFFSFITEKFKLGIWRTHHFGRSPISVIRNKVYKSIKVLLLLIHKAYHAFTIYGSFSISFWHSNFQTAQKKFWASF